MIKDGIKLSIRSASIAPWVAFICIAFRLRKSRKVLNKEQRDMRILKTTLQMTRLLDEKVS